MKNIHNNSSNLINILNLSGDYIKDNEHKYLFSLLDSNTRVSVDEIYKIIDPSNDQAFKILFNGDYKINNINGLQRAKSLIQSLLYKYKDDKIINNIGYLPNEIPEVSGKNRKKLKVLDCPLLCEMTDKSQYIIDLELQNYYYDGLDLNSLVYGTALYNAYRYPVVIIVLLMKDSNDNISFELKPYKKVLNETVIKPIDDYVYVFCLDLYYVLDCLNNNIDPNLDGLKLSKEGKEWIKLLTVKDWMKKCNRGENSRYPIPKNLNNSEEIISAIQILNSDNNSNIIKNMLKEKEYNIITEEIISKDRIKLWINEISNKKIIDKSVVPFPKVAPEFLIKECKNYIKDKGDCLTFLDHLFVNQIIEPKKIYQTLIDNFYE